MPGQESSSFSTWEGLSISEEWTRSEGLLLWDDGPFHHYCSYGVIKGISHFLESSHPLTFISHRCESAQWARRLPVCLHGYPPPVSFQGRLWATQVAAPVGHLEVTPLSSRFKSSFPGPPGRFPSPGEGEFLAYGISHRTCFPPCDPALRPCCSPVVFIWICLGNAGSLCACFLQLRRLAQDSHTKPPSAAM